MSGWSAVWAIPTPVPPRGVPVNLAHGEAPQSWEDVAGLLDQVRNLPVFAPAPPSIPVSIGGVSWLGDALREVKLRHGDRFRADWLEVATLVLGHNAADPGFLARDRAARGWAEARHMSDRNPEVGPAQSTGVAPSAHRPIHEASVPYSLDGTSRVLTCAVWDGYWVGSDILSADEVSDQRSLLLRVCGHGPPPTRLTLQRVQDLDPYLA